MSAPVIRTIAWLCVALAFATAGCAKTESISMPVNLPGRRIVAASRHGAKAVVTHRLLMPWERESVCAVNPFGEIERTPTK